MSQLRTHDLNGLDGSNPLAFLAAIGVLRTVGSRDPAARMKWRQHGGAWRPRIETAVAKDAGELVDWLVGELHGMEDRPEFDLRGEEDNTTVTREVFAAFAQQAQVAVMRDDRREADYAVAFGCEQIVDGSGRIGDTDLRTMSGSGSQHFLAIMRKIIAEADAEHLRRTLFEQWDYADSMQSRSLRWDPSDDRRYGYRWTNPGLPKTRKRGSMLGANRLAIEGMSLFPTLPVGSRVRTTGFRRDGSRVEWTWPIWSVPVGVEVLRSLLSLGTLQDPRPDVNRLRRMGVAVAFRSQRISSGYYRNFAPARQV